MKVHGNDVIGVRERLFRPIAIAEERIDRGVVGHLVPDRRGTRPHRVLGMVDPRQHVIVDVDRLGGIERPRQRLGHDHRHRLTDMARLVRGQQQVGTDEDLAAAGGVQLHVVFGLGQRIVRNGGKAVGEAIRAGEHAEHARHRHGAHRIHPEDARMRMRGAHHHRVGLAVETEIVAEPAAAGGEPLVFLAHDGLADDAEVGEWRFLFEISHRRQNSGISTIAREGRRMMNPAAREAPSFPPQMQIYVVCI